VTGKAKPEENISAHTKAQLQRAGYALEYVAIMKSQRKYSIHVGIVYTMQLVEVA
jgi:hypothetical protein